ncbi:MAG: MYXO-CTERM sorting domain-containing protein [Polyangiaceae bacterium]
MRFTDRIVASSIALLVASNAWAAPPTPTGAHPRLFMSPAQVTAYGSAASQPGTAAHELVRGCDNTFDEPTYYDDRGGADGDNWPGSAMRCAFAYKATGDAKYLTQAIKYWRASLDDDQTIGDKLGCVAGVDTNWQTWDGSPPAPPVILTVTHDTGYPIRWYGADIALVYDWLNGAPGVDAGLLAQTRTCLGAWVDWYADRGYHHDEAGANYNAGYVISQALAAVAIGADGGSDGHVWKNTVDELFPNLLVGKGLANAGGKIGEPAGVLVGGDWAEGWQYGPLSVLEYAVAARALEENGAPQPEMNAWANSLATRYVYATVPDRSGSWVGGDFDDEAVYTSPSTNALDAVLAAKSSDEAASWAAFMKQAQGVDGGVYFYNALAETRSVSPVDLAASNPARWYVARGTRALFARSDWTATAFWSVFSSAPSVISDHMHYSASNFVLTRGADHLVVDPSRYGEPSTFATNAVSADSTVAQGDYGGTQTPWSEAELVWARGTDDGVYAARSDFAKAFIFSDTPSDIPYAHREWVMLPEGEIVTIDRVHTADAQHDMYVRFHTNTGGGGLVLSGKDATGTVGGSKVVIHGVSLSGGTPHVTQPEVGECSVSCSFPCGACDAARFPVDEYAVDVPGPQALAIHVIDALGASEAPAIVSSMNDDAIDPAPKTNAGVIGAAVFRGTKQSFVVASSGADGAVADPMKYGIPGGSASRHIVYDAPEDAAGESLVTGVAEGDRCIITITQGKGFPGHPLLFKVASAKDGCAATPDTAVDPGMPPPAGGAGGMGGAGGAGHGGAGAGNGESGCGCRIEGEGAVSFGPLAFVALAGLVIARRGRKT